MTKIYILQEFGQQSLLYFANLRAVAKYLSKKFGAESFWMYNLDGENDIDEFALNETGLQEAIDYTKQYLGSNIKPSFWLSYNLPEEENFFAQFYHNTQYLLQVVELIQ